MNERKDYEKYELDTDSNFYWNTRRDIKWGNMYKVEELVNIAIWFRESMNDNGGWFYKGTALYFTYKGIKYYMTWIWYHEDVLKEACRRLKKIGATNIQINYGELD